MSKSLARSLELRSAQRIRVGATLFAVTCALTLGGCPGQHGSQMLTASGSEGATATGAAEPATADASAGATAGDANGAGPESPDIGALQIFPPDNPWNQDIAGLPVHPRSADYLAAIGLDTGLHADFGTVWNGAPNGIPYTTVRGDQTQVPVAFDYADESDPGPYPIPPDAPIEGGPQGGGDRHVLVVDVEHKLLYELFAAYPLDARGTPLTSGAGPDAGNLSAAAAAQVAGWTAGSGAIFDLTSNALRPRGWTSADAAGLPIFPGLARYEEAVGRGEIRHALRFTVPRTQRAYIPPATHYASSLTDPNLPPMGLRVRLRAAFDVTPFPPAVQVILRALQRYGMFVADNGSAWYISGAPDPRWNDDELHALGQVRGRDFEVVYTGAALTD